MLAKRCLKGIVRLVELRHLRYFVTIGELLNFTKAAQKLRVAQPALSRQIRDLEDELGVKLFDRTQRAVKLTEAGNAFHAGKPFFQMIPRDLWATHNGLPVANGGRPMIRTGAI